MFGKTLKAYWKGDDATRYFVPSKGQLRLGKSEFKAQGGEGAVYVKGSSAYKIYTDPSRCITQAKIDELAALVQPNIIRPLELVIDGRNRPVGYSMRSAGRASRPTASRPKKDLPSSMEPRLRPRSWPSWCTTPPSCGAPPWPPPR